MPNKSQQRILALIFCFLSDLTLVAWIYFMFTSYSRYVSLASDTIDSPDFQIQLYKVILQSLTFMLLIFIAGQAVVYILAWRKLRSAYFYLKFFAVLGFVLSLYISIVLSPYAILPMIIYAGGYYVFAGLFKAMSEGLQTQRLSSTLEKEPTAL